MWLKILLLLSRNSTQMSLSNSMFNNSYPFPLFTEYNVVDRFKDDRFFMEEKRIGIGDEVSKS